MSAPRPETPVRSVSHFGLHARMRRRIAGLSIVELMVALTIGLILLLALTRLFVTSRSTYTLEEGLARVQESGRFAMEFLAQDIRMAGYAGCSANLSSSNVKNNVSPAADATTFNPDGISGFKYACTSSCTGALTEWSPSVPSTYFGSIMPVMGTDVLIIQRADTLSAHLVAKNVSGKEEEAGHKDKKDEDEKTAELKIYRTTSLAGQLNQNDILMISDCKNADIFKVTNNPQSGGSDKATVAHGSDGNLSPKLSTSYGSDAQIMKLVTRVYFIGRRDSSSPPSLYRGELGNNGALTAQELVEGMESMKLSYGEDTTNDRAPDIYRDPVNVANWRKVLSVRVGLLASTTGNVDQTTDTRTYDLAGNTVGPLNDKKKRRAFNSVIQMRNHY